MAIVLKDRVKQAATAPGTGTITLGATPTGFQSFSVVGNGNVTYFAIVDGVTGDWEVNYGTYTSSGTTLTRNSTPLSSSNSGSLVNFVNAVDVFVTYPSENAVWTDTSGVVNATSFGAITATSAALTTGTVSTTPASNTDIANKSYVDGLVTQGISYHEPVFVESPNTTGNLTATYNNGSSGVGATLTNAGTQVALTVDGILMTVGKRVLIYNQTNAFENGVYTVTTVGTGSTNWVLTRATDADTYGLRDPNALGYNDAFFVTNGNTGAGETYVCTTSGVITFGTTAITFAQISSAQVYSAGTGLTLTNTTFSITPTGTAGTYGSASQVPVFVTNASGQVTSVTNTNIAINGSQVSGNISGSAGSVANALTLGTYLTGTSFNGSAAVTATVDATSANTASKVVARDSSGDFSAGTITAALSGNATTATTSTNLAGGTSNQLAYQSSAGTTTFATAPSATGDLLNWNGSAFAWTQTPSITSITLSGGTANGVTYLNGSKVLTSGSALVFDGTNFTAPRTQVTTVGSPPAAGAGIELIGSTSPLILAYNRGTSAYISLNTTASAMQWNIGASAAMSLDTSGNLGIGTSSPSARLTTSVAGNFSVAHDNYSGDGLSIVCTASNASNGGYAAGISFSDINGGVRHAGIAPVQTGSDNNQIGLAFFSKSTTSSTSDLAERMRIDSSGNVGIGTTSPSAKLELNDGSSYIRFTPAAEGTIVANGSTGLTLNSSTASTSIRFRIAGDERARIDSSGNLLVGGTAARGTTVGTAHLDLFNGTAPVGTLTNGVSLYSSSGDLKFMDASGNAYDVGFRNIPQNAQTGNYTLVLSDSGKHIYHAVGAGAATYTIPANASVAYPIGTALSFVNLSSTSISIAITSDTMYLGGTGTTGTRTLANYGTATALKVTSTVWIITGSSLT